MGPLRALEPGPVSGATRRMSSSRRAVDGSLNRSPEWESVIPHKSPFTPAQTQSVPQNPQLRLNVCGNKFLVSLGNIKLHPVWIFNDNKDVYYTQEIQ